MMRFFLKKVLFTMVLVVCGGVLFAQSNGPGVPCFPGDPCDKKPTSPIDMYVYVLAIVAIMAIAYFAKRFKTQKI